MQAANRLQKALRTSSGLTFGAWQMLPGSNIARLISRCGYDWVLVDTEHGNVDDAAMHESVAAIAACGVSPVVRVAGNEGWMVKRALDAGAHGIIVPLLYTAADATKLVQSAKFPPMGVRGFGSPFSMEKFGGVSSEVYQKQANGSILTIVQIETKEALENVDAIAQVDGIDMLFVGPFDLGNNIGHPVINNVIDEELKEAVARVLRAAKENGKHSGIFCTSGEQARMCADQGFQMISVATDFHALQAALTGVLTKAKGSYAHSAINVAKGAMSGAASMAGGSKQ